MNLRADCIIFNASLTKKIFPRNLRHFLEKAIDKLPAPGDKNPKNVTWRRKLPACAVFFSMPSQTADDTMRITLNNIIIVLFIFNKLFFNLRLFFLVSTLCYFTANVLIIGLHLRYLLLYRLQNGYYHAKKISKHFVINIYP